ncbi:MAG: hypothetical protein QM496_21485 [Verrucomicrobiota bacterium]
MNWARMIARFEVLKFRRSMARDRHVFREDLMDQLIWVTGLSRGVSILL